MELMQLYATLCNMKLYETMQLMQLYTTLCNFTQLYATCNFMQNETYTNLRNFMQLYATLCNMQLYETMQLMQLYTTLCNMQLYATLQLSSSRQSYEDLNRT